jgi:outer membrane protein OmpA-like peptidoglycan-associated protein
MRGSVRPASSLLPKRPLGALLLGMLPLAACATRSDLVVVLPESNGHVGAVVVDAGKSRTVLDKAYAAAAPRRLRDGAMDEAKVRVIFGDALAALPQPPLSQDLFFQTDSLELTPDSALALTALLETIKTRKAVEVVLTGHTDTMGTNDYNDLLSRRRAETIRETLLPILARYGVAADAVETRGRGKRDLLVATPDQTPEPRNRRVEITLR